MDEVVTRAGVVDAVFLNVSTATRGGVLVPSGTVFAGWVRQANGAFTPPAPSQPSVPESITDRQFFHALALNGEITQDEALEAVGTGTIPAKMAALVAQMPANAQFTAKMMLRGAQTFRRDDATTETIRQLYGWTHAQVDDLWRQAATL